MIKRDEKKEFEQGWFSLEFKNPDLESEFLVDSLDNVQTFGKVVVIEVVIFNLIDTIFEISDTF